jgi:chromosome segregation ATPase
VARTKARGERVVALERERAELDARKEMLDAEIADDERRLAAARKEKADAEAVRDRMRDEHAAREQELDGGLRALLRDLDRVTDQTNAIKAFIAEANIVIDRDDQIMGTGGAYSGYPAGINVAN